MKLVEDRYISLNIRDSKLEGNVRPLSILVEMSDLLSTSSNLNELLKKALSKVLEFFDLEAGRIYLIDNRCRDFFLVAHQGLKSNNLERLSFDNSFSGKAARTRSFIAQYVTELEDRKRASLLQKRGFKIVICVPLIFREEINGVMNLATGKEYDLDQDRIDLLITIGNQMAMAVNNAILYKQLQERIESLKEKNKIIKYFAYSVSHDLKSPASGIYGLTRRLKEKYGPVLEGKGREYCDKIMNAAEQMVDLVGKINSYIAAKEAPFSFQRLNIQEITETLRTEFSSRLKERNIQWKEPGNFPEVVGDKLALLRVFRNFIDNALKHGGEEMMTLKIGYTENQSSHVFSFYDDGIGIKAEESERLFGKFQKSERSRETAGSGMGLAIVKEIAERHGGKVWVDGGNKKGTTFCMSISKNLKN